MDPHIASGLSSMVGAVFGTGVTLLTGWLSRKHERERDKDFWDRQKKQEDAAWFRDKVLEAYSGCLYHAMLLGVSALERSVAEDREVSRQYAETQRHLLLLRAYISDPKARADLDTFSDALLQAWNSPPLLSDLADKLAEKVGELLARDERVNAPPAGR